MVQYHTYSCNWKMFNLLYTSYTSCTSCYDNSDVLLQLVREAKAEAESRRGDQVSFNKNNMTTSAYIMAG